jgi:predicted O-methyltransferase YrrM
LIGEIVRTFTKRGVFALATNRKAAIAYWRSLARAPLDAAGQQGFAGNVQRVPLDELVPSHESVPVTLLDYRYVLGGLGVNELLALCRIARHADPKTIFEFGTFLGGTTLQLAANTDAEIFTLDLAPRGHPDHVETEYWGQPDEPGLWFRDSPYSSRIHQLYGNSQTYDFSEYIGKVDFVFVDAAHKYDPVLKDTQTALELVAPGGLVVWHDYSFKAEGVRRVLEELATTRPLRHIGGTSLAVYRVESD